jgi:2-dehydro-3-deoxyphosphogluconate aldolase/(4S)-4-hydroxy-2-oxoglutarate aldolase
MTSKCTARAEPSALLRETGVVAVLRARHASEFAAVVDALIQGGVRSIELTLSTQGVFEGMPALVKSFGDTAELGIGTVTTLDQAREAMDVGARYLVTPTSAPDVTALACAEGIPIFPGGLTPTELFANWSAGATAVKVFPASVVGPGYISQLRGPFPDISVIPSGGVAIEDAPSWIAAGAVAVSLGGPLLGDAFHGGDLSKLVARAERVRALVEEARA